MIKQFMKTRSENSYRDAFESENHWFILLITAFQAYIKHFLYLKKENISQCATILSVLLIFKY